MQDLLVSLVELIVISFILIMVFDFIIGLVHLARTVQSQSKVQIEPEAIAPAAITPMREPLKSLELPDPWTLPSVALAIPQRLAPPAQSQIQPRDRFCNKADSLYLNSLLSARDVGVVEGCPLYYEKLLPLLLLPQAKEISTQPPLQALTKPVLNELLTGVDLDTLKLRPARKIASALGLAQKVNKRDLPLEWLRAQIKKRLEQTPTETARVISEVLKAS